MLTQSRHFNQLVLDDYRGDYNHDRTVDKIFNGLSNKKILHELNIVQSSYELVGKTLDGKKCQEIMSAKYSAEDILLCLAGTGSGWKSAKSGFIKTLGFGSEGASNASKVTSPFVKTVIKYSSKAGHVYYAVDQNVMKGLTVVGLVNDFTKNGYPGSIPALMKKIKTATNK